MPMLCGGCAKRIIDFTATLSGSVVDVTDGEPVDDATVTLRPGGRSDDTGLDGFFEFQNLEAGTYTIQVMANGYKTETRDVILVPGETVMMSIPLKKQE